MEKETSIENVENYIKNQPIENQEKLIRIRKIISNTLQDAQEVISYQMPAYKTKNGVVIYFGAFKKHYSLFFRPKYLIEFKEDLQNYSQTKSAIHVSYSDDFPEDLLIKMLVFVDNDLKSRSKKK